MSDALPYGHFRHTAPVYSNGKNIPLRNETTMSSTTGNNSRWDLRTVDSRRLPSILSMRLSDWIDSLTNPLTGAFPNGISPKQMDQLAHSQVANSSVEHGVALRPLWKTGNHLGVLLWNEVKAGRIQRLHKACYVGKSFTKLRPKPISDEPTNQIVKPACDNDLSSVGSREQDPSTVVAQVEKYSNNSLQVQQQVPAGLISTHAECKGEMEEKPTNGLSQFQCFICTRNIDEANSRIILKCKGCPFQCHMDCSYPNGIVPISLLSSTGAAVSNWRCYDCKCCQLCSKKDDMTDGLLLCDGCDSGEHMGCQDPPIRNIPPAPWYCSMCRNPKSDKTELVEQATSPKPIDKNRNSTSSIIKENPQFQSIERSESSTSDKTPESNEAQTEIQSDYTDGICKLEPSTQSAWVAILNSDTPPLSDETGDSPVNRTLSDDTPIQTETTTVEKQKPIKIRLGKRANSTVWEKSNDIGAKEEQEKNKRPKTRSFIASMALKKEKSPITVTLPVCSTGSIFQCPTKRIRREESRSPSPKADDFVLKEEERNEIRRVKSWSVAETSSFLERMGFKESAAAFKREEIDGPALLLLQRQDVLHSLGVKLGPALKTYKFVKYIQYTARIQ